MSMHNIEAKARDTFDGLKPAQLSTQLNTKH